MQVRHFDRVRNDGDRAAILLELGNGQADAFDGNRAFVDGVLLDLIGQFNVEPPVLRIGDAVKRNRRINSEAMP